jgi:hypothetical protein
MSGEQSSGRVGNAFLWTNHPDAGFVKLVHPVTAATVVAAVATVRNAGLSSRQVPIDFADLPLVAVFSTDEAGADVVAAQPVLHPQEMPINGSFVFHGPAVVNLGQSGS